MPIYAIRRNLGPISRQELDAAAFRATACAAEYDGLRWDRSFWNPSCEEMICYYEARNSDQIRQHSHQSNIPCDEISEVTEILPGVYAPTLTAT